MFDLHNLGFRYRALFPIPLAIIVIVLANPTFSSLMIGSSLIVLGIILRVICLGYLGVKSRDEVPNIANLVTAGPYKYTRNPVYIANTLIASGLAIFALGGYGLVISIMSTLIVAILYISFYNFFVIPAEEKFLEEKFGQDYLNYKKQVPRWLINFKDIPSRGRFRILPVLRTEYWTWIVIIGIYTIILVKGRLVKL
ncbi:MAG: isoprenylcysteine carboxylmethyltransferase family protein [Candidatus Calescibacterium sp.]|nr:isoprenylcysteine carboxylmethyltransferase family protein [Candidatus Calescibacterium sp.]MCX7972632.1 isoprenylcysteine carboxylmethyltransferase family protein [bacterium]MDW8194771.1 isoprenylcysteine carboxylmethyltransferase family protein [Candidatus Calescibacterium sp.]